MTEGQNSLRPSIHPGIIYEQPTGTQREDLNKMTPDQMNKFETNVKIRVAEAGCVDMFAFTISP